MIWYDYRYGWPVKNKGKNITIFTGNGGKGGGSKKNPVLEF